MPTVTPPSITALPTPPDPNDRSTFNSRAYPWSVAQQTLATEVGAVAANVKANADDAAANATLADADRVQTGLDRVATAADRGQTGLDRTQTGLDAVATAADRVQTGLDRAQTVADRVAVNASLVSIAGGPVASVNGRTGVVTGVQDTLVSGTTVKTINGASLLGAGDLAVGSSLLRSARTSNTALGVADKGTLVDITSGTFTQTFDAAATLGNGWFCHIRNAGSGDITLDPSSSELIDGLTSYVMYPGECRLLQCDGSALRSVVVSAFYKTFTTSGTFIKPPGYSLFEGLMWGGGGGASDFSYYSAPSEQTIYHQGSGGGGGCMPLRKRASELGSSEAVAIGAGGVRRTAIASMISAGGNTTFSNITAYGGGDSGQGGGTATGLVSENPGFQGLVTTDGSGVQTAHLFVGTSPRSPGFNPTSPNFSTYGGGGGGGQFGANATSAIATAGSFSFYGGGGAASRGGVRGGSFYGGRGADASNEAEAPGGGGHYPSTDAKANGARGELRIWGII